MNLCVTDCSLPSTVSGMPLLNQPKLTPKNLRNKRSHPSNKPEAMPPRQRTQYARVEETSAIEFDNLGATGPDGAEFAFRSRQPGNAVAITPTPYLSFAPSTEVDFYKIRDTTQMQHAFCLILDNVLDNPNSTSDQMLSAYYSIICLFFPGLEEICKEHMTDLGLIASDHFVTEDREVLLFDEVELIPIPVLYVYFGQLVLVAFKNVSPVSYLQYMTNRSRAIEPRVGVGSDQASNICVPIESARKINSKLASARLFKKLLMIAFITLRRERTVFSSLCSYFCNLMEWYEMGMLKFIFEALVTTQSAVLDQPEVAQEVMTLKEISSIMSKSHFPQYFRLLGSADEYQLLEKSKLQVLTEVAVTILKVDRDSLTNFVTRKSGGSRQSRIVQNLVSTHAAGRMRTTIYPAIQSARDYLRGSHITRLEMLEEQEEAANGNQPQHPPHADNVNPGADA